VEKAPSVRVAGGGQLLGAKEGHGGSGAAADWADWSAVARAARTVQGEGRGRAMGTPLSLKPAVLRAY
jgi:hypothetical protein